MDIVQLELAHWIMFYEQVYELPPDQRPADDVIEDDDQLDEFVKTREHQITMEYLKLARDRNQLLPDTAAVRAGQSVTPRASRVYSPDA